MSTDSYMYWVYVDGGNYAVSAADVSRDSPKSSFVLGSLGLAPSVIAHRLIARMQTMESVISLPRMPQGMVSLDRSNRMEVGRRAYQERRQRPALVPGLIGAIMLVMAIFDLSIGYYSWLRVIVTAVSIYLCVLTVKNNASIWLVALIPVAVVWNPFGQITMSRSAWIPYDLGGAAVLALAAFAIVRQNAKEHSPHL
ncbi:DUF6804 family protein [Arthrobacter sp. OAP107]|uniref:DUF6804 family protein n=1 Tax=Arthrobacter sp. OAP107 TaxID=3156445 RepID=UPI0033911238